MSMPINKFSFLSGILCLWLFLMIQPRAPAQVTLSGLDEKQVGENEAKAEKGDSDAQWIMGIIYATGKFGRGVDIEKSDSFFRRAAKGNEIKPCVIAGTFLLRRKETQDEAIRYLQTAYEKKSVGAAMALAAHYFNEGIRLKRDDFFEKSFKMIKPVTEIKNAQDLLPDSFFLLGLLYQEGISSKKETRDFVKASEAYLVPAKRGNRDAMESLIECYCRQGDFLSAAAWGDVLAENGPPLDEDRKKKTREWKKRMKITEEAICEKLKAIRKEMSVIKQKGKTEVDALGLFFQDAPVPMSSPDAPSVPGAP